jgi:tight adherence protein B
LSFAQALDRVVHDAPAPIADEFSQVLRSTDLGMLLPAALHELAARTGSADFEFFASIVAVQYRTGGSLAGLLATLADNIKERLEFAADVGARTAQARFSGWVLAVLPFGVLGLLLIASPGYVSPLLNTVDGRIMLLFAGALLGVGLFVIRASATWRSKGWAVRCQPSIPRTRLAVGCWRWPVPSARCWRPSESIACVPSAARPAAWPASGC